MCTFINVSKLEQTLCAQILKLSPKVNKEELFGKKSWSFGKKSWSFGKKSWSFGKKSWSFGKNSNIPE